MGRIVRAGALAVAVALSGCVGAGPAYTPEEAAAVVSSRKISDQLARDHKITWTEAARRNIAEVLRVSGTTPTDADQLLFSYRLALAAEVDAGRMTPELADYRFKERIAANQAAAQQRQAQTIQAIGNAISAGAQAARQNQSVTCTSTHFGITTTTTCD